MDAFVGVCKHINLVFETNYVYKSLVVVRDPAAMYHMYSLLQQQDYPIGRLTSVSFCDTSERFRRGNLRMLIMSEMMFRFVCLVWTHILDDVDVIFCNPDTPEIVVLPEHIKFFSLCI
jgi:hypothetical protein